MSTYYEEFRDSYHYGYGHNVDFKIFDKWAEKYGLYKAFSLVNLDSTSIYRRDKKLFKHLYRAYPDEEFIPLTAEEEYEDFVDCGGMITDFYGSVYNHLRKVTRKADDDMKELDEIIDSDRFDFRYDVCDEWLARTFSKHKYHLVMDMRRNGDYLEAKTVVKGHDIFNSENHITTDIEDENRTYYLTKKTSTGCIFDCKRNNYYYGILTSSGSICDIYVVGLLDSEVRRIVKTGKIPETVKSKIQNLRKNDKAGNKHGR